MNEIAVYMTTITAVEYLCFQSPTRPVPGDPPIPLRPQARWSLAQYDIYLEISSQQVVYAIWGLQIAAGDMRKGGFWPVIGRYSWQEEFVGRLDFGNRRYPLPGDEGYNNGARQSNASFNAETNSSAALSSDSTVVSEPFDGARLTIVPTYRGERLSPRELFGTAIDIMVLSADYGLETYCLRLQRYGLVIIGAEDTRRQPLLKYKYLIRAMGMLLPWMVANGRLGEIDVKILRDGVVAGNVRIEKRRRSIASS